MSNPLICVHLILNLWNVYIIKYKTYPTILIFLKIIFLNIQISCCLSFKWATNGRGNRTEDNDGKYIIHET